MGNYKPFDQTGILQQFLLRVSLINLGILSLTGLFMRSIPVFGISIGSYDFILHAHSHFAFGGWITPVILWMIMQHFPLVRQQVNFRHSRNIITLLLLSAYGMLISFALQGYAAVSIAFSTLSVAATWYLAAVLWKNVKCRQTLSALFLKGALFFLVLSAIGPFAAAFFSATGNSESTWYMNSIYFYLHFQYNGWFIFSILAVIISKIEDVKSQVNARLLFYLFLIGCMLTFFLSTLWSKPGHLFNMAGGAGALLQVGGFIMFFKAYLKSQLNRRFETRITRFVLGLIGLKTIIQLITAIPGVAETTYSVRNLKIAYLHFVLLGIVTVYALSSVINATAANMITRKPVVSFYLFLTGFFITEILLVIQGLSQWTKFSIPYFHHWLFYSSMLFPVAVLGLIVSLKAVHGPVKHFSLPHSAAIP